MNLISIQHGTGVKTEGGKMFQNVWTSLNHLRPLNNFTFFSLIFVILGVLDTEKALKISQRGITIRNIFLHRFNAHMQPLEQLTQNQQNKRVL